MATIVKFNDGTEVKTLMMPSDISVKSALEVAKECGCDQINPDTSFIEREEIDENGNKVWWVGIKQGTKGC